MRITAGILSLLFLALSVFQSPFFFLPFLLFCFFFVFSLTSELGYVIFSLFYFLADFLLLRFSGLGLYEAVALFAASAGLFFLFTAYVRSPRLLLFAFAAKLLFLFTVFRVMLPEYALLAAAFGAFYLAFGFGVLFFSRRQSSFSLSDILSPLLLGFLFVEILFVFSYLFVSAKIFLASMLLTYGIFAEISERRFSAFAVVMSVVLFFLLFGSVVMRLL